MKTINLERVVSTGIGIVIGIGLGRADVDLRAVPIYIVVGALILWGRAALDKRRERNAAR